MNVTTYKLITKAYFLNNICNGVSNFDECLVNENRAKKIIAAAVKCLKCISIFSGGSNRLDDSIECYTRAANMFKMSKNWSQAGKAFCEAANLHSKSDSRHDAATKYVDASNCYKKTDPNEAVNCLLKAIEIYTDMGRFTMAAKHHQSIAEMYESEANDLVSQTNFT